MHRPDVLADRFLRQLVGRAPERAASGALGVAESQIAVSLAADQNQRIAVVAAGHPRSPSY
jgi:hypothetical protein